jgi:FPC/CPF motif-containing protein YcgG
MAIQSRQNPFDSAEALENSSYARYDGEQLLLVSSGKPAPALAERVHAALRALILDPEYPCVGSRSALNQGSYRFGMYQELASPEATAGLARDLYTFLAEQPSIEGEFTTFIACFDTPKSISAEEFEQLLWRQLKDLSVLDREHHDWAGDVSIRTGDPDFAFSFAARSFFVVGLSPAAERWARRFPWPLLAFNSHAQFQELKREGRFELIRDTIRERETNLEGEENPNVEDFGVHTEASQYAGRRVEPGWRCPVSFED